MSADLRDAVLADAYLTGADLTGANLTGANLTGADLTGAILTGAKGLPRKRVGVARRPVALLSLSCVVGAPRLAAVIASGAGVRLIWGFGQRPGCTVASVVRPDGLWDTTGPTSTPDRQPRCANTAPDEACGAGVTFVV